MSLRFTQWQSAMMRELCAINDLLTYVPFKGDKSEDCQRVLLENRLMALRQAVQGTQPEDLK